MKKSDEIRRKTWRMIAKNLIVLAALAVAAVIGVMSWFTQHTSATADGISTQTEVEEGLEFYIMPPSNSDQYDAINSRLADNAAWNEEHPTETQKRTTWHTSSDGEVSFDFSDQEFKFMEGLFLCEVTGDGADFNVPKLMQYDNIAYVDETQDFDAATANDEYMSFDIYFRSEISQPRSVSLMEDSAITANTTYQSGTITNFSKSTDAENRKDIAIGAVRMAVLNLEAQAEREVLWIPGPDVYYDGINDTLYTGLSSSEYANKGSVYFNGTALALRTGEGTDDHAYYAAKNDRQVFESSDSSNNMFVGSQFGSDQSVVTMSKQSGNYRYGRVRVNLWIEGEDAEARLAFVGGKFDMKLHFSMTEAPVTSD